MKFFPSLHVRSTFTKLANERNLTYYGTITESGRFAYQPVLGITASPDQHDNNYTSGAVSGYNIQLLQRSHDVYLTNGRLLARTWTIVAVNLKTDELPRMLISGRNQPNDGTTVLANYLNMYEINPILIDNATKEFAQKFAVFAKPRDLPEAQPFFTPEFQHTMAQYCLDFDFETDNNIIYVYSTKQPLRLVDLDRQLRAAIWFATHVDQVNLMAEQEIRQI